MNPRESLIKKLKIIVKCFHISLNTEIITFFFCTNEEIPNDINKTVIICKHLEQILY